MSFQAYLDNIEQKTGLTPRQLLELAQAKGFGAADVKAQAIIDWLAADYGLGRGHAMAIVQLVKRGAPAGESGAIWLDGKATRPA
ncbi:MAG: DUF4287 domain-containing protein [Thermomicrobiales bacterium]|nr:DUF4287 domain-containing protein [Thermomicrobiales bacterium]